MVPTLIEIYIGMFMIVVAIGMLVWFERGEAEATTGRMARMMRKLGLDPKTRKTGAPDAVQMLKTARKRCGRCRCEGLCERWLEGKVGGTSGFCPNTPVFDVLNRTGPYAAG